MTRFFAEKDSALKICWVTALQEEHIDQGWELMPGHSGAGMKIRK